MSDTVKTVIVGAGQSGLALSYFLKQSGQEHIVLEKARQPGEAWRNQRWNSFTLVTPNWTFRLPGGEYQGDNPHGFMPRDEVVNRFENYVAQHQLPVTFDCQVTRIEPVDSAGFQVHTPQSTFTARNVVIATGFFQTPRIPDFAARLPLDLAQLHTSRYRNPQSLPEGTVLVVGSGQSGMQIAEELAQTGRRVILSTSGTPRVPRRYRGKDIVEWLYLSGFFNHTVETFPFPAGRKFVPPAITGKDGGHSLNLHRFFRDGVNLVGRLREFEDGKLLLAADLRDNLARTDNSEKMMLSRVDEYIQRAQISVPEEQIAQLTDAYAAPEITSLDLKQQRIGTIIWAGGYQQVCPLAPAGVLDEYGLTRTRHCQTQIPGLYILGIPFISKLKSGFLFGVAEDAQQVAEQIGERA